MTSLSEALIIAGLVACASPAPPVLASTHDPAPGAMSSFKPLPITNQDDGPPPLTPRQARQLGQFNANLTSEAALDPQIRLGAAEELILLQVPQATDALDAALRSGRAPVIGAVLEALERQSGPVEGLLEPLVDALTNAPPEVFDRLSVILTRYGGQALDLVAGRATDESVPLAQRLGPIRALSTFRSRTSAARLIELLRRPDDTEGAIHQATCEALGQLTGLFIGNNVNRWLEWWSEARDKTREEWRTDMLRNQQTQIVALLQEKADLQSENDAITQRLIQAYRELFPVLPEQARLALLPTLLDDSLPPVRQFAVDRVNRILRDAATISPELQDKLAQRLTDSQPDIRKNVAELLDSIGYADIAQHVAQALATEQDRSVVASYLGILTARPTPNALASLCQWVEDDTLGGNAADAIWALLMATPNDAAPRDAARNAFAARSTDGVSPAHLRLMAYLRAEDDLASFELLLDGDDPEVKNAIAEGFAHRDHRQPLLDRASDDIIYPHLIRSLADDPADLDLLGRLALQAPPEGHGPTWEDAVQRVASSLPAETILAADDLLRPLSYAGTRLRANITGRVAVLPPDQLPASLRPAIIARWSALLLDLGEATRAFEAIETVPDPSVDPNLPSIKFRAALMIGQYDVAALLDTAPAAWIAVLDTIATDRQEVAISLRDEITRRFEGQIEGKVKVAFDAANNRIPPQTPPDDAPSDIASGGATR